MNKTFSFPKWMIVFILVMVFPLLGLAQHIPDSILKKNITAIENPLQKLLLLNPKTFEFDRSNYRYLKLQAGPAFGFISEDLETVFPELVRKKSISYLFGKNLYRNATIKVIDDNALIPVMIASIKEQQSEIEMLKTEIKEMKQKMDLQN
ncbi:MAG: tail fiber domain-containing protein [Bacteroidota bacterium]